MLSMTKQRYIPLLILIITFCWPIHVAAEPDKPFTGAFRGYGRICYGSLFIKTKTIAWNNTYSFCSPSSYKIIEKKQKGNELLISYLLTNPSKKCSFKVISLSHQDLPTFDMGWQVTGYHSLDEWKANQASVVAFRADILEESKAIKAPLATCKARKLRPFVSGYPVSCGVISSNNSKEYINPMSKGKELRID